MNMKGMVSRSHLVLLILIIVFAVIALIVSGSLG